MAIQYGLAPVNYNMNREVSGCSERCEDRLYAGMSQGMQRRCVNLSSEQQVRLNERCYQAAELGCAAAAGLSLRFIQDVSQAALTTTLPPLGGLLFCSLGCGVAYYTGLVPRIVSGIQQASDRAIDRERRATEEANIELRIRMSSGMQRADRALERERRELLREREAFRLRLIDRTMEDLIGDVPAVRQLVLEYAAPIN